MRRLLLAALTGLTLAAGVARADELFWADADWYRGEDEKAVAIYRQAASQGNKVAQRRLGSIYAVATSLGDANYAEAFKWYRLAATQGDAEAMDGLALLYRDGTGVPQDYVEALRLLRRAVVKGLELAKYHLGQMYQAGQGVPRDYVHAYMWFSLGAGSDAGETANARDAAARYLTPKQIGEAQRLADACQLRSFRNCD